MIMRTLSCRAEAARASARPPPASPWVPLRASIQPLRPAPSRPVPHEKPGIGRGSSLRRGYCFRQVGRVDYMAILNGLISVLVLFSVAQVSWAIGAFVCVCACV